MKLLFTFLTGCLLFSSSAEAIQYQNKELDSLAQALEKHAKRDTAYWETLITLARKSRYKDFNKSELYFAQAIALSKKLSDDYRLVKSYNGAGITYGMQDNYAEAIKCFNQALQLSLKNKLSNEAGTSYSSLGIVYKRMGEYDRSLAYYAKSLQQYDSLDNPSAVASTRHNLGVLFDMMHEPEKAMEYFNQALAWYRENNDKKHVADLQTNIANVQSKNEEYDSALQNYQAALDYYEESNSSHSIINTLVNLGWLYYAKGEFDSAESILEKALPGANRYRMLQEKVSILYTLGKTKADQGHFSESIRLAGIAKDVADSIQSFKKKRDAQQLLSYVYEKSGNFKKALEHFKNASSLEDSLFNENNARTYKNQQVLMEVHEKDKQLEAQMAEMVFLNREITLRNRWQWMLGLASFFLLLAGLLYYQKYRQRRKYANELEHKNRLITKQKKEIEAINLQLEKRMLRAQMNPHFIFNALSAIQHFIISNDRESSLHYLSLFSSMLRQVLETSVSTNMALKDEIELLKIYLELEALRFEKEFSYKINIDGKLDVEMLEIPTMLIQPFVENAILHGLMPQKGDRKLTLDIYDNAEYIACSVTDNGIGREAAARLNKNKTGKAPSRGISVTSQRLELLARNYGLETETSYFDLKDNAGNPTGTQVIINIPKQEI